jgi:molybdopterin-guanine dinucleotide biosynthesis protein A
VNGIRPVEDVAGVILAGGKSRRYGKNKALVAVEGVPLIERVADVLGSVFHRVVLITNSPDEYKHLHLPMFEDLVKGLGPLGGIVTGLSVITEEAGFLVACDMPFLNPSLIRYMIRIRGPFHVVVPRIRGDLETLHALYSRQCLPALWKFVHAGEYQVFRFFMEAPVRYVEEGEIRSHDPDLRSFININDLNTVTTLPGTDLQEDVMQSVIPARNHRGIGWSWTREIARQLGPRSSPRAERPDGARTERPFTSTGKSASPARCSLADLCAPDGDKTCFACCPPIRPAGYEHVDHRAAVARMLRENTLSFRRKATVFLHPRF